VAILNGTERTPYLDLPHEGLRSIRLLVPLGWDVGGTAESLEAPRTTARRASVRPFCSQSPIDASSGTVVRKELDRGGNCRASEALWRIEMVSDDLGP